MSTTFTPRTAHITIYQGDDYAELVRLNNEIERAKAAEKSAGSALMSEASDIAALVEQYNERLAKAEKRAAVVTVQALTRKRWRELVAAHPPREDNDEDEAVGVNEDKFPDALVPASVASIKPSQGDQADFLEALSDAQFAELYNVAFYLNRSVAPAPKALSAPSPSSSETSN